MLLLRENIKPLLAGLAMGVLVVLAMAKYLKSVVYGVSSTDPETIVCVIASLATAAVVAIIIPAYRVSRSDPVAAIRYQ